MSACQLCLDHPQEVLVRVANGHPCALERFIELDVCDNCVNRALTTLDEHPYAEGMACVAVRWAA